MGKCAYAGLLLAFLSVGTVRAQTLALDRSAVVLDPAHGGADPGARISAGLQEKDVTLAVALQLRSVLAAKGFAVFTTRAGDTGGGSTDQRAEFANRSHAVACLVLHASNSTNGVVLGTSTLGTSLMHQTDELAGRRSLAALRWDEAQEPYVLQSGALAKEVGSALVRSGVAVEIARVVVRPLDNLTCPALAVEVGALPEPSLTGARSQAYLQQVAESVASALIAWRSEAQPPDLSQPDAAPRMEERARTGGVAP